MTFKIRDTLTEFDRFRETQNGADFRITAPQWQSVVNDFARRLNIEAPELIRVPTPFINAIAAGTGKMYVTDGMIKLLESDAKGVMSRPMQSVIAHEMGHMKYHMNSKAMRWSNSWKKLPFAGVLALALYEYASGGFSNETTSPLRAETVMKQVDQVVDQTLKKEKKLARPYLQIT